MFVLLEQLKKVLAGLDSPKVRASSAQPATVTEVDETAETPATSAVALEPESQPERKRANQDQDTVSKGGAIPAGGSPRTDRRMSVAMDGVAAVAAMAAEEAMRTNSVPEQVFEVVQFAPGKPRKVQLKVGGMGLTILDGPKMLDSCVYQTISSFDSKSVPGGTPVLAIVAGKKKRKLQFRAAESEAITALMRRHEHEATRSR